MHHHLDACRTEVAFDTTRKAEAIAASLVARPIPGVHLEEPVPLTRAQLLAVHDAAYVDAVLTGTPRELATSNELPGWDAGLARSVLATNGGVLAAARHAVAHRTISGSLSSGLHHARRDRGAGYCTFNGLALAALDAVGRGARRVLVLDVDAHCGGGTASILSELAGARRIEQARIEQARIEQARIEQARIEQVDVSVDPYDTYDAALASAMPAFSARRTMATADDYLDTIVAELDRIADPGSIDLVLHNAGMDPHHGCEGGLEGIDAGVLAARERLVFDWIVRHRLPTAWVLAGGYTNRIPMAELVDLHRLTVEAAATAVRRFGPAPS